MKLKILQIEDMSRWRRLKGFFLHNSVDNTVVTVVCNGKTKKFTLFQRDHFITAFLLVHYGKNRLLGLDQFNNDNWDNDWSIVMPEFKAKFGSPNPTVHQVLGIELSV